MQNDNGKFQDEMHCCFPMTTVLQLHVIPVDPEGSGPIRTLDPYRESTHHMDSSRSLGRNDRREGRREERKMTPKNLQWNRFLTDSLFLYSGMILHFECAREMWEASPDAEYYRGQETSPTKRKHVRSILRLSFAISHSLLAECSVPIPIGTMFR